MRIPSLLIALAVLSVPLGACSTLTSPSAHQTAENLMIDADSLYAGIATACNLAEAAKPSVTPTAERIKMDGWTALVAARTAYAASGAIDLSSLRSILTSAQSLQGAH